MNDFETDAYGNWQTNGVAFGPGPAGSPSVPGLRGARGGKLASSLHSGPTSRGTLLSPKFKIARRYINFLLAGGQLPDSTGLEVLVEGKSVFKATGNDSNQMTWQACDLADYLGQSGQIVLFDFAAGSMGYILADHIVQSDVSAAKPVGDVRRRFTFEKSYLLIPVKIGAQLRTVKIEIGDTPVRQVDVELSEGGADYWVFLDLAGLKGETGDVVVNQFWDSDAKALDAVVQSDSTGSAMQTQWTKAN